MDIIEDVVTGWFNSQGYFTIQNLRLGLKEIDILAVKLDGSQNASERIHIEISVSSNPIGYMGGSSSAKKRSSKEIEAGVKDYIENKFNHKKVKSAAEKLLGKDYEKWFVCGVLKDEKTVKYFEKFGIKVIRIWDILKDIKNTKDKSKACTRLHQLLLLNR